MIRQNAQRLIGDLPAGVELVAAAKNRSVGEIEQAIAGGIRIIGENYVQEAEAAFGLIGRKVKWHFIGHLQKNKVKKAVRIFDMIETIDSQELAEEVNRISAREQKLMPVLMEINSGKEAQKFGVMPDEAEQLVREISGLNNIRVMGLFTMGPYSGEPELARPYFSRTKKMFDQIKALNLAGVQMQYLSMGMSNSYRVAIEEGANLVRIGTKIFGERDECKY